MGRRQQAHSNLTITPTTDPELILDLPLDAEGATQDRVSGNWLTSGSPSTNTFTWSSDKGGYKLYKTDKLYSTGIYIDVYPSTWSSIINTTNIHDDYTVMFDICTNATTTTNRYFHLFAPNTSTANCKLVLSLNVNTNGTDAPSPHRKVSTTWIRFVIYCTYPTDGSNFSQTIYHKASGGRWGAGRTTVNPLLAAKATDDANRIYILTATANNEQSTATVFPYMKNIKIWRGDAVSYAQALNIPI